MGEGEGERERERERQRGREREREKGEREGGWVVGGRIRARERDGASGGRPALVRRASMLQLLYYSFYTTASILHLRYYSFYTTASILQSCKPDQPALPRGGSDGSMHR